MNKKVDEFFNSKWFSVVFALIIFSILMVPFYILGEDAVYRISDTLTIEFIQRIWQAQYIKETGVIYGYNQYITEALGGELPRHCLFPALNVLVLLLILFKPITALIINLTFIRIISFVGMFLLLKKHVFEKDKKNEYLFLITGVSCCFMMLPFFTPNGISVAAHPLVAYAFLNLLKESKNTLKQHLPNYLILILYGFYSQFVTSGFFVLWIVGCFWLFFAIKHKNFYLKLFCGIALLTIIYTITDFNLIRSTLFDSNFVSHRVETKHVMFNDFTIFEEFKLRIADGIDCHTPSFNIFIIIVSMFVMIIAFIFKKYKQLNIIFLLYAGIITLFCIRFLIYFVGYIWELDFLNGFNFIRFIWFVPFLITVIFAYSIFALRAAKIINNVLILFILMVQICLFFSLGTFGYNTRWNNQAKFLLKDYEPKPILEEITFRQFYDIELLKRIENYIGKPKSDYYVLSVGLNPAVSQYNGFFTIDGHFSTYPLKYKKKFRKIIETPLVLYDNKYSIYDDWGNKLIAFNHIVNCDTRTYALFSGKNDILINIQAAKNMKADYLFSSFEITNYKERNLKFLKKFESDISTRIIYLYEIL